MATVFFHLAWDPGFPDKSQLKSRSVLCDGSDPPKATQRTHARDWIQDRIELGAYADDLRHVQRSADRQKMDRTGVN